MRWVSLRSLKSNRVLAQHILDERGRVLLAKGMTLTPTLIKRLYKLGIGSVCIEDALTDDLAACDFITPETRRRVLEATYNSLTELTSRNYSKVVKPVRVKQRLKPLLREVISQMREIGGAGEHVGAVYLSDGELYHHSVNVMLFALALALAMGLAEDELVELCMGTLLHDVGKLKIPDHIMKKPGKLTSEEFELIKLHTSYGYELLRTVPDLSAAAALIALEHHERYDGSGYPRGLQGDEIHFYSRLTAVVDVYEALTANRVYRNAYLPHQAYELLLGGGGTQFDPVVIDAFVRTIAIYPVGMTLLLSNGYRAVVSRAPRKQTQRPVVRVVEYLDGTDVAEPWELDLSKELTVQIVGCES